LTDNAKRAGNAVVAHQDFRFHFAQPRPRGKAKLDEPLRWHCDADGLQDGGFRQQSRFREREERLLAPRRDFARRRSPERWGLRRRQLGGGSLWFCHYDRRR
jgi:hypothetical protein